MTVLLRDYVKQKLLLPQGAPYSFFSELGCKLTWHCSKAVLVGFLTRTKSFPTVVRNCLVKTFGMVYSNFIELDLKLLV